MSAPNPIKLREALLPVVHAAGGQATTLDGAPLSYGKPDFAAWGDGTELA